MEVGILNPKNELDLLYLFVFETLGTCILVTGISLANGLTEAPWTIICVLLLAICLSGRISGAHFNVSVTLGLYIIFAKWKQNLKILLVYILG